MSKDVSLGNPEPISLQHLYRAMDFLLEHEESLDGKYLLSSSDDTLSPEDVAVGYKQRKEERIRAHILLCYLSLLLVRIAELKTGETWDRIRPIMDRCHLGEFSSKNGCIFQQTELTSEQVNILNRLKITRPPSVTYVQISS